MGQLLIVDGSDVCRAPLFKFILNRRFAGSDLLAGVVVESRGLTAAPGQTMCESASGRLGFSGPAIRFYGAQRAIPLSVADIAGADLVLTAERVQRSAVVRKLPGTQASVFTYKEALVLASVLMERRRLQALGPFSSLLDLTRELHGARGTVALVEPPVRTGGFHWRRPPFVDPLTIQSGHDTQVEHRRITQECADVAELLGDDLVALTQQRTPGTMLEDSAPRGRRLRRSA